MNKTRKHGVTLTTILHDPENRQFELAKKHWPILTEMYEHVCVAATPQVSKDCIDFFRSHEVVIEQEKRGIGGGRRRSLELALKTGADYIHYADFDRVVHWVGTYPQEISTIVIEIPKHDFFILGRTARAFASHPEVQQITESITNKVFFLVFGTYVDVTAGSSTMKRKVAELLISNSRSKINDTDTEWPLIAMENRFSVEYMQCEGLEFETPDYYKKEIKEAGSLEAWMNTIYNTPAMWKQRAKLAECSTDRVLEYMKLPRPYGRGFK